jgi:DEAD/DEAH box helicase domain-containing protein
MRHPSGRDTGPAARILRRGARSGRLMHIEQIAARAGEGVPWPEWVPAEITEAFTTAGVGQPWAHQAAMAEHAHGGSNVIISTPAASGKSLGYLLPALTATVGGRTVLYLAPTRALAADQLRTIQALGITGVCAAVVDGDTHAADRERARTHANYLLTTPDMLHHVLLPRHARWGEFFGRLHYVIVDECHGYRGVFGSHVAHVFRRLQRVAAHHARRHPARTRAGTGPPGGLVFLLASATISEPGNCARLLTGAEAREITDSTAPRGPLTFGLWEPPLTAARGEGGAPVRRPATAEAATLLADLVAHDVRGLAFTRSRRGAEAVAIAARRALAGNGRTVRRAGAGTAARIASGKVPGPAPGGQAPVAATGALVPAVVNGKQAAAAPAPGGAAGAGLRVLTGPGRRIAAYRSGYLPEDRRELEEALRTGALLGLAATTALELGVNICGLDAVLIAGWPGSRAALWQQAGRAGREGQPAVAVLIARDDPLDTYLVHHPEMLLRQPVESTVLDPQNPYVLAPHLCAAAAELPLTDADLELFGTSAGQAAQSLVDAGMLRRRGHRLYWTRRGRGNGPGLRGEGNYPVKIVEKATGRLVGTVDQPSAHILVHTGAVYLHQGELYLVTALDLDDGVALVEPGDPGYTTSAREVTGIDVVSELRRASWGAASVSFGEVDVVRQVTSFTRRNPETGQPLGEEVLDLPPRALRTRAVWWTISAGQRENLMRRGVDLAGAAHAAEHTAIGLLPLFAACDRMDIGGVSADLHPATGLLTVFVYDGNAGGAGFAERGFAVAAAWLRATAEAIHSCECQAGCPSCVQSPKCGTGNEPLAKDGALVLLETLLAGAPANAAGPVTTAASVTTPGPLTTAAPVPPGRPATTAGPVTTAGAVPTGRPATAAGSGGADEAYLTGEASGNGVHGRADKAAEHRELGDPVAAHRR